MNKGTAEKSTHKPTPMEAFEDNMADAKHLLKRVEGFTNRRTHKMRTELRERIGYALRIPKKSWDKLDCLESDDVFVTFKPKSRLTRDDFLSHEPLLRQSLVAGCAAFETYMAECVLDNIGSQLNSGRLSSRMASIPLDLGTWMGIHEKYSQKKRGLRKNVLEPWIYEHASSASNRVGELLALLQIQDWSRKLDSQRDVEAGRTVEDLDRITKRRNRIAHQGDRDGRGRARISLEYVTNELDALEGIAQAVEATIGNSART